MISEERCKEIVARAVADLHDQLREVEAKRKKAEFEAEVAKWAVAGVAGRSIHLRVDDTTVLSASRVLEISQRLGRSAAEQLLHSAGLAFKDSAHYHEALRHIRHLEKHLTVHGVAFTPFSSLVSCDALPDKWDWPTSPEFKKGIA